MLDVVYNHFGPDGNYLHAYAPAVLHRAPSHAVGRGDQLRRRAQPHGARFLHPQRALLARGISLRRAALRCRARDSRRQPAARSSTELARRVRAGPGPRAADPSGARERRERGAAASARPRRRADATTRNGTTTSTTACTCILTGERDGYYVDYAERPHAMLCRALAEGFAYQGEPSAHAGGTPRGEPSAHLPPTAFVSFLQNHDQIGNRAFGERLSRARAGRAPRCSRPRRCCCSRPAPPMLFMGEEWAAAEPFPYFCDFEPELAKAVREGRRNASSRASSASRDDARSRPFRIPRARGNLRVSAPRLERSRERAATRAGSSTIGGCSRCAAATSCRAFPA